MKDKNSLVELLNHFFAFVAITMTIMTLCMWSVDYIKVKPEPSVVVEPIDMPKAQAVFVHKVTHFHSAWAGTGFYLKYGNSVVVVTNAHVCLDHDQPETSISVKGKMLKVGLAMESVIAIDSEKDLCLITSSVNKHLGLSLVPTDYKSEDLDEVYTIGFPHVGEKDIKVGRIVDANNQYIINMRTVGGQSGSPILNKDNQVVGVIWGRQTDDESRGLYVPVEALREFVKYELYGLGRDQ